MIILDLELPDGDGVDFILDVRDWSTVPIIVLSARTNEADKIRALDAGADDYLTKPFGVGELLARVRSAVRRLRQPNVNLHGLIQFGDIKVDIKARLVTKANQVVHLTPTEYRLLMVLVTNAGRVVRNCCAKYGGRRTPRVAITCVSTWGIYGKSWMMIPRSLAIFLLKLQWATDYFYLCKLVFIRAFFNYDCKICMIKTTNM